MADEVLSEPRWSTARVDGIVRDLRTHGFDASALLIEDLASQLKAEKERRESAEALFYVGPSCRICQGNRSFHMGWCPLPFTTHFAKYGGGQT